MTHLQRETRQAQAQDPRRSARWSRTTCAWPSRPSSSATPPRRSTGDRDRRRSSTSSEVEVEEECLKILALYQPVAGDLRFVVAVIKINSELERIGDLADNIAERALRAARRAPGAGARPRFAVMAERTGDHPREGARRARAPGRGRRALRAGAPTTRSTALYRRAHRRSSRRCIRADIEHLDALVLLFSVARYLERLADHATNIAEDVLYMVEGEIHRHQRRTPRKNSCAGRGRAE